MPPSPSVAPATTVALACAAVALDAFPVLVVGSESATGQWWTSVGLWTAVVAVSGPRRWAPLVVAMLVTGVVLRLANGAAVDDVLLVTGVRALEVVAAALVLTSAGRSVARLDRERDLGVLVLAALAAAALSAGHVGVHAVGAGPGDGLVENFCQHTLSVLALTAVVLAARNETVRPFDRVRVLELGTQVISLAAAIGCSGRPATCHSCS